MTIEVTSRTVADEQRRLRTNAPRYVDLINRTRDGLGEVFSEHVDHVSETAVRAEIDAIFADEDLAMNVTGFSLLLGALDVEADYPGFIVDEVMGRQLAITIADGEPRATLAAATFHVMDAGHHVEADVAGVDDRECGIAAGLQVRLPGWAWQASEWR